MIAAHPTCAPGTCAPPPMIRRAPVTDRQRQYAAWIDAFHARRGFGPTMRELAAGLGVGSLNAVNDVLQALRRKGVVAWEPRCPRTLRVVGSYEAPAGATPGGAT